MESRDPQHEHPRGTLAILLIYLGLFAAGWLALYFGVFVGRGPLGGR